MTHLKVLVGLLAITVVASPAAADLLLFDFEEFTATSQRIPTQVHPGALTMLASTRAGVTAVITRTGGEAFDVVECTQPDFPVLWGGRAIDPWYEPDTFDWFVATFSAPLVYAELQMTDFGGDDDTAFMEVYEGPDGTGPLLATVDQYWGMASSPDFAALSYTAEPGQEFQSIKFRGYGVRASDAKHFPNSMYVDNLGVIAMPEPATAALLGLGVITLFFRRRRRTRGGCLRPRGQLHQ